MIERAIARMRSRVIALVSGLVGGAGLFFATAMHIPRESRPASLDIELLRNYLPGYSVSWPGALLGLGYGMLIGAAAGGVLAWFYNRLTVAMRSV